MQSPLLLPGGLILRLQQSECHNINLITPTHCVANIVYGLRSAIAGGLHIPLVYNCGGYEPLDVLRVLERILTSICRISSTRTGDGREVLYGRLGLWIMFAA